MPFRSPVVFVDVETTGSSPQHGRITEIAVVRVDDWAAEPSVGVWSTLVSPGRRIPPEISFLTGITNDMVADAPRFEDIAPGLAERLAGALFVAHHVRFDYGFVKAAFARVGIAFHARTLCTVRLSRLLYPERSPHTLDALIARHRLPSTQRHRALGDARVLFDFVQHIRSELGDAAIEAAVRKLAPHPNLPSHLPPDLLERIPDGPGVYRFYGSNTHPLYIGKSRSMRERVAQHFCTDFMRPSAAVRLAGPGVEWQPTAGIDFGARLLEIDAIAREMPSHNVALRRIRQTARIGIDPETRPCASASLDVERDLPAPGWIGPFSSRAARHCSSNPPATPAGA
ncbi:MAG: exonuclease domain-containing protein [Burkholderiaceae bacterium]